MAFDDVMITENTLEQRTSIFSQTACAWECMKVAECLSFAHTPGNVCQLYSKRFVEASLSVPSVGTRYYSSPIDKPTTGKS